MIKLILTYDGTNYFGWQKTKTGPSIQEEIGKAVLRITGEEVSAEAASRTDRGVHARGQVVQFELKKSFIPEMLQRGLNAVLPKDIRVVSIEFANFHPTLDAIGKEYHYQISIGPVQDPTLRYYSWHIHYPLDTKVINSAAKSLIGTHDFSAFANIKEKNPICSLESIEFKDFFIIRGDRFLYKMVRNIVGTLVYVGCGKIAAYDIPKILESKDRKLAGVTAPALGLYLHEVQYSSKLNLP